MLHSPPANASAVALSHHRSSHRSENRKKSGGTANTNDTATSETHSSHNGRGISCKKDAICRLGSTRLPGTDGLNNSASRPKFERMATIAIERKIATVLRATR